MDNNYFQPSQDLAQVILFTLQDEDVIDLIFELKNKLFSRKIKHKHSFFPLNKTILFRKIVGNDIAFLILREKNAKHDLIICLNVEKIDIRIINLTEKLKEQNVDVVIELIDNKMTRYSSNASCLAIILKFKNYIFQRRVLYELANWCEKYKNFQIEDNNILLEYFNIIDHIKMK